MNIKNIFFFNMIEILLALTVIAIGMTSVLGLFPVGLNASRNAIAQNCSADVADQMVTYMRVMGESSASAYTATFVTTGTSLPIYDDSHASNPNNDNTDPNTLDIYTNAAGVSTINLNGTNENIDTLSLEFLDEYKRQDQDGADKRNLSINNSDPNSNFERVAPDWAIFIPETSTTDLRRRVYFIVQGTNCTQNTGAHRVDYSAMALVWKSTVRINCLKPDGDPAVATDWVLWPGDTEFAATPYKYSGKLNIELSWPLELPYAERKKRYYQLVITNPNP